MSSASCSIPHEEILGFGTSLMLRPCQGAAGHALSSDRHAELHQRPAMSMRSTTFVRNNLADGLIFSRTEPLRPARAPACSKTVFPSSRHGRTEFSTPHPYVDYDNFAFAYEATKPADRQGRRKLDDHPAAEAPDLLAAPAARFHDRRSRSRRRLRNPRRDRPRLSRRPWCATIFAGAPKQSDAPDGFVCPRRGLRARRHHRLERSRADARARTTISSPSRPRGCSARSSRKSRRSTKT